jgi:hypothetical protein
LSQFANMEVEGNCSGVRNAEAQTLAIDSVTSPPLCTQVPGANPFSQHDVVMEVVDWTTRDGTKSLLSFESLIHNASSLMCWFIKSSGRSLARQWPRPDQAMLPGL